MLKKLFDAICFRLINGPLSPPAIEFQVSRLDLRPGDILVLRFKEHLPPSAPARAREHLARIAPGHKVLILDGGADLAVLTAADIEARTRLVA